MHVPVMAESNSASLSFRWEDFVLFDKPIGSADDSWSAEATVLARLLKDKQPYQLAYFEK